MSPAARTLGVLALTVASVLSGLLSSATLCWSADTKKTGSARPYTHRIELYDAAGRVIDPTDANAPPYSPRQTCKRCHEYEVIAAGTHFPLAQSNDPGRDQEPWVWVDRRTATVLPLTWGNAVGSATLKEAGLASRDFLRKFGGHTAGGYDLDKDPAGHLEIDCMSCHVRGGGWSHSEWSEQISQGNFSWAATAALGLATVSGSLKSVNADAPEVDATRVDAPRVDAPRVDASQLPRTHYDLRHFDPQRRVFFDVVRSPADEACASCHTVNAFDTRDSDTWHHVEDIHSHKGIRCVDCHGHRLDHSPPRGVPGADRAASADGSCRGCHLGSDGNGRDRGATSGSSPRIDSLGAPVPQHRGLPPVHLQEISCTTCHSGAWRDAAVTLRQTSRAHELGVAHQGRGRDDPPLILAPILERDAAGRITPYQVLWPSFWGWRDASGTLHALPPDDVFRALRRPLRVRRDLRELGDDWESVSAKILQGLQALPVADGAHGVWVAAGQVYSSAGERLQATALPDDLAGDASQNASPRAFLRGAQRWRVGHPVRPARDALGSGGCTDCHSADASFFAAEMAIPTPFPTQPATHVNRLSAMQVDPQLLEVWEQAIPQRPALKWGGWMVTITIALLSIVYALVLGSALRDRRRGVSAVAHEQQSRTTPDRSVSTEGTSDE